MISVIIVDDDKLVCSALKTILEATSEVSVKALGSSASDALDLYKTYKPDIILLDIRMGEKTGIEAGEEILSFDKAARILFLTTFSDDNYIIKALKMGAKGYLLKQNYETILPSVKSVYSGQCVYGEEIVSKIPRLFETKSLAIIKNEEITSKELDIMELVAEGLNNKEIAGKLYLSEGTVRNYLSVILEKLNLRDRTQLAIYYLKNY